ncbi:Histidinol-phosphate aminotransferase [Botrimarina colliarenosi]|uniref:Histidinol-phosphate aminotransferase n=1 Tax=Botrimarina colliarenosi TaxID=2528001 RepID=A0A5C6ALZ3_9BACT|nr:histidinol-phosphate transaminase [Botrimarina colliarenosi]TWT99203.1 Histidinol-phosphate aminotransferase [Botrimarina colliarenosi]
MFREAIEQMSGYVPGEQPRGMKLVKLNTNENPYPPSPKVVAAIQAAAEEGLQRYPDPSASAFRNRAAEVLSAHNAEITPDWILCGNGSDDILTIATRAFVDQGRAVRYPWPTYSLYKTLAEIQGVRHEAVPCEPDWSVGFELTAPSDDVRLVYLANPNSPSGTLLEPGEVAAIADTLDCPLLVDEAYVDFAETNCLDLVRTNERVLVSRTLSKSYGLAGLRFGYLVAQPHVIEQLAKVKDSYNCDTLSIAGATAAIDDQAWLADNVTKVVAERQRLDAGLLAAGFDTVDSRANFVWATHPTGQHEAIYQNLKAEGVLVRLIRHPGWSGGDDGLRVSVGTPAQTDTLLALLATL